MMISLDALSGALVTRTSPARKCVSAARSAAACGLERATASFVSFAPHLAAHAVRSELEKLGAIDVLCREWGLSWNRSSKKSLDLCALLQLDWVAGFLA